VELWKSRGSGLKQDAVTAWVPFSFLAPKNKPFLNTRWVLKNWHRTCSSSVPSFLKQSGMDQPEVAWLDSIRHYEWAKSIGAKSTVLRIADWTAGFPDTQSSVLDLEKELIGKVDLVITSAESLTERIKDWRNGKPLVTIRNGVDTSFWSIKDSEPAEYKDIPGPRILYVGALDDWFDFELLFKLATTYPKFSFVVIGQLKRKLAANTPSNIHFLGAKSRNIVRSYMQHSHVGIIPFKRNDLIECVCPLKLYEYMSCGLPVVATGWEELRRMKSPALLASSVDDWIHFLGYAVSRRDESILKNYASSNDWRHRWNEWFEAYATLKR
jgi:glycosyltransferase involved in cell wall biosynthesis